MDASTLLAVWEAGSGQGPIRRALALLAAAWPDRSTQVWARVGIGARDEHLLVLREALFGDRLEGVANCPRCGQPLELTFTTDDIRAPAAAGAAQEEDIHVEAGGYALVCRVPNSLDLLESERLPAGERQASLMRRCVVAARRDGANVAPESLPEGLVPAVAERLAQADSRAAVELDLACPACGHRWLMVFDVLSYLWGEIEDWAQRLVLDVHALASAYGWSEREILAMTPVRRRLYLDLLGA